MPQYDWVVEKPTTGGPYAYLIKKDGAAMKAALGLATPNAALNAIRDDIAADLAGATIVRMAGGVQTVTP